MSESAEILFAFFRAGGAWRIGATFGAIVVALLILRRITEPSGGFPGLTTRERSVFFALLGLGLPVAVGAEAALMSIVRAPTPAQAWGHAAVLGSHVLPFLLFWSPLRRLLDPKLQGIVCHECTRFIHQQAWICDFCHCVSETPFDDKCGTCGTVSASFLCPWCDRMFFHNRSGANYCAQLYVDPSAVPPREALLSAKLAALESESRLAQLRQQIRDKEEFLDRSREHSKLGRMQRIRREMELEIETELSKNLERKLVFSGVRKRIEASLGKDEEMLSDALVVLSDLEERYKVNAMKRLPKG